MKEHFESILSGYSTASEEDFVQHPIGNLLRNKLPNVIRQAIGENERFIIKGSAGQGQWVTTPWIAILDILITKTAQAGYYPVYLFRDDLSGVYLSLNQGVTRIKEKYKKGTIKALRLKAEDYRNQIVSISRSFTYEDIILEKLSNNSSELPKLYEAGNILSKFYPTENFPDDGILYADLFEMLAIYETLSFNKELPMSSGEAEQDEEKFTGFEDLRKIRLHKRIERNQVLIKKVKQVQGYTCKACKMCFTEMYGSLGENYIEAHHLTPFSQLAKHKLLLDSRKDFVVLCANCHRMIHKLDDPSDLDLLISYIKK